MNKNKNKIKSVLFVFFLTTFFIFSCKKTDLPEVITSDLTNTLTTASCGGSVTSDGGAEVTAYGVCWSTQLNPTIDDYKTINGSGIGTFISEITGLEKHTHYFLRAYATNTEGTSYGNTVSFTTSLKHGQSYAGGLIFYIDSTLEHGLVAAPTNLGIFVWDCSGFDIPGAVGTDVGTGYQNTLDIVNNCSEIIGAAYNCHNLNLNGYSDWFLPSQNELYLMYLNLHAQGFGNFNVGTTSFWSSTEYLSFQSNYATAVSFDFGGITNFGKAGMCNVRAARKF